MSEVIFTEKSPMRLRFLILVVLILLLLVAGTFVYHIVEGWSYIDSLYFSAVSLATRGYGDLHPTQVSSKLFTVFYLFLGVALILYALSSFIGYFIQYQQPAIKKKMSAIANAIAPPKKEKWIVIRQPKGKE